MSFFLINADLKATINGNIWSTVESVANLASRMMQNGLSTTRKSVGSVCFPFFYEKTSNVISACWVHSQVCWSLPIANYSLLVPRIFAELRRHNLVPLKRWIKLSRLVCGLKQLVSGRPLNSLCGFLGTINIPCMLTYRRQSNFTTLQGADSGCYLRRLLYIGTLACRRCRGHWVTGTRNWAIAFKKLNS